MTVEHPIVMNKKLSYPSKTVVMLILLISAASLFYSVFISIQTRKQLQPIHHLITIFEQNRANQQANIEQQIAVITQTQAQLQQTIHQIKEHVTATLQESSHNNDWLLLKTRYYLELAAINQQFSDNTPVSIALLKQAQSLLSNQHDARLYPIMQAIANDKARLELAPTLDKAEALTQLNAAFLMVQTLQITPFIPSKNRLNGTQKTSVNHHHWRDILNENLQQLKQLIIIRHHDSAIEALTTPTDEAIIRDNIFLNLQQAQWAILQSNQMVYNHALTQAINNIKHVFNVHAHQTSLLIQQLNQLQAISFEKKQPIGQESIVLLNKLIAETQLSNTTKASE